MKHPIATFASALLLSTSVHAQELSFEPKVYPTDDSAKFSVELAVRLGSLSGQVLNEEDKLYKEMGLVIVDNSGNSSATDPVGSVIGFDISALYAANSSLQFGIGLLTQSTSIHPGKTTDSKFEADFMTEQAILAKARFRPIHYHSMKFGVEAGVGPCFGTLNRFALAQKNISVITSDMSSTDAYTVSTYVAAASKTVDVSGFRYEMALMGTGMLNSRIGADIRLGFHHSSHSIKGTDTLDLYARKYPSSVSSLGFDFSVGLIAAF